MSLSSRSTKRPGPDHLISVTLVEVEPDNIGFCARLRRFTCHGTLPSDILSRIVTISKDNLCQALTRPLHPLWAGSASPGLRESGEPDTAATPAQSVGSALGEILQTLVLALVIFLLIRNVVQNFRIEGVSMEPNFQDGQFLFINRWSYCPGLHLDVPPLNRALVGHACLWQPQRGDVIVFRYPLDPTKDYIKRVIGLPVIRWLCAAARVYVNGQLLPEPYSPSCQQLQLAPGVVPAGDDLRHGRQPG